MDENSTYYVSIKVGNNTYDINEKVVQSEHPFLHPTPIGTLNAHVPDQAIFSFTNVNDCEVDDEGTNHHQNIALYFQVPEELFDQLELRVRNRDHSQYYKPIEHACADYPSACSVIPE
jgi:hypothetical protein